MNKIMHASELRWDFSDRQQPKVICIPQADQDWERAEIDVVNLAACCAPLTH
jgi:hypothetical protein